MEFREPNLEPEEIPEYLDANCGHRVHYEHAQDEENKCSVCKNSYCTECLDFGELLHGICATCWDTNRATLDQKINAINKHTPEEHRKAHLIELFDAEKERK